MHAFKGDSIILTNIGSLASVEIEARAVLLGPNGKPDEVSTGTITAQSDRTSSANQSSQQFKHDGEIISAHVRVVSGSPVRGQLFAVLRIRNGPELCRGYLTIAQGVNLGTFEDSLGGRGLMRSIDLGDPAANADFPAQTVPTNAVWFVRGFAADLVTAASGVDRMFRIDVTDGTDNVGGFGATKVQDPSITLHYILTLGGRVDPANATMATDRPVGVTGVPGPYPGDYVLEFATSALGASDNWGDGQLLVEEWLVA